LGHRHSINQPIEHIQNFTGSQLSVPHKKAKNDGYKTANKAQKKAKDSTVGTNSNSQSTVWYMNDALVITAVQSTTGSCNVLADPKQNVCCTLATESVSIKAWQTGTAVASLCVVACCHVITFV